MIGNTYTLVLDAATPTQKQALEMLGDMINR